jgi:diguanylate cyclase (GGDEF)-like protein
MTFNKIVKETIESLKDKKLKLTPDNYTSEFCLISRKYGVNIDDCEKKDRYISKLSDSLKDDIAKYNVTNTEDLIVYLIGTLNRASISKNGKDSLVLLSLIKNLLESIKNLHNKKARDLANASMERLEYLSDNNSFSLINDKWSDFNTSYDSHFINKLKLVCDIKTKDFDTVIEEIIECFNKESGKGTYKILSEIIIDTLTPSFATNMDDDLASLSYELKTSPSLLTLEKVQNEIKALTKRRTALDRAAVKKKIDALDGVITEVSSNLFTLMDKSNVSREKILKIKKDLNSLGHAQSFDSVQGKLLKIADSLEFERESLSDMMHKDTQTIKNLHDKVHKLELALVKAKHESNKDFLTTLLSKKGIDEELMKVEKSFERYEIDYSICFFDLDSFKMINDTFGHEAGDVILKNVGIQINQCIRDIDIVGRYGGEEFLAVLPNTSLEGAVIFSNKIRRKIEDFKFLYKGERIYVTISAGVAVRANFHTQEETIDASDKMLYKAKRAGRNRVYPEV